ncbi:MAG: quinate 5-dehydrogenase, partial [Thermacetogeniaceae bacterium]
VVPYLERELGWRFAGKTALLVSGVDRFGLAEALDEAGCRMIIGDLIFSIGIPIPIRSLSTLRFLAALLLPIISQLPFKYLYPTGKEQETVTSKYEKYYLAADIIAGDFHFIRRYMPPKLPGKVIITNTVTAEDVELLRERGVAVLVTTTPEMQGRSFGTNVLEGVLVSLIGKRPEEIKPEEYIELLEKLGFKPRVEYLQGEKFVL